MDVSELALYNSVLSGGSLDGTNFFYVNPLRKLDTPPADLRWPQTRKPFLSSFCCPPNLVRTITESADYAYAKSDDALWINLYGGNTLSTTLPGGQAIRLTQATEYHCNGLVRISINEREFAIRLRIPGWADGASIRVNSRVVSGTPKPATYFEIRRVWKAGDVIEMNLEMPAHLVEANPLVEETLNQIAVQRGPIVYCLESADLPRETQVMDVVVPQNIALAARYDERVLGGVALVEGKAFAMPPENWNGQLYRELKSSSLKPINLRLIPYCVWGNRGPSEMTVWMRRGGP